MVKEVVNSNLRLPRIEIQDFEGPKRKEQLEALAHYAKRLRLMQSFPLMKLKLADLEKKKKAMKKLMEELWKMMYLSMMLMICNQVPGRKLVVKEEGGCRLITMESNPDKGCSLSELSKAANVLIQRLRSIK